MILLNCIINIGLLDRVPVDTNLSEYLGYNSENIYLEEISHPEDAIRLWNLILEVQGRTHSTRTFLNPYRIKNSHGKFENFVLLLTPVLLESYTFPRELRLVLIKPGQNFQFQNDFSNNTQAINSNFCKGMPNRTFNLNDALFSTSNKLASDNGYNFESYRHLCFEQLFHSAPEGIVMLDKEYRVIAINAEFTKIFGYDQFEAKGRKINELIVDEEYLGEWCELISEVNMGQHIKKETIRKRKDGSSVNVSIVTSHVVINKHIVATYGIYRDITEKVDQQLKLNSLTNNLKVKVNEYRALSNELLYARELAIQSEKMKQSFVSNISHEIRTPMNGILGFTQLLKECSNNEERIKYISEIENSSSQLLNIINNLIEVSRMYAQNTNLNNKLLNINKLLHEVYSNHVQSCFDKNINLVLGFGLPDNDSEILIDVDRLAQVLNNLITNSIKHTEKGFVRFGYYYNSGSLVFYVKDSGSGIPKDRHKDVFKVFCNSPNYLDAEHAGMGLGLAISKYLVEQMGGIIGFESEENIGTTFLFSIPINIA